MSDHPTAYDERRRLAVIITDSRNALAEGPPGPDRASRNSLAAHLGRLEALLHMLCDSAEIVLDDRSGVAQPGGGWISGSMES